MTFGNDRWGSSDEESRRIFHRFVENGGNVVDVADGYAEGKSEEVLGSFIAEAKLRDKMVVATKFTFAAQEGNPNSGGNGRKNIYRALEGSLRRLKTDYVDLYWMHVWDMITPVEEVVDTLTTLVRSGKNSLLRIFRCAGLVRGACRHFGRGAWAGATDCPATGVFVGGAQHRA